jgi:hypothetical protein
MQGSMKKKLKLRFYLVKGCEIMIVGFLLEKLKLSPSLYVAYLKGRMALKGSNHLPNLAVRRTNLLGMNCVQQL